LLRIAHHHSPRVNQKTILFLEDEGELLETIGMVLREQGYAVVGMKRAEDALTSLKSSRPDLILADIKLPGIDGFDFFQQIQQLETARGVPFVFLTAFNNLNAAVEAKKKGAAEYITKPFDFDYLVTRIRELVPP
jgi:DNA-binding response OmpR family regulator